MSKQRKLQIEIDQTLRKIADGVEEWDVLYEKFEETEDAGQRDKIAQEMKKELKKLQRLREQVRGWATDINDPRLAEARRSVEREMERFKGLEKELKIKQFSSEGLKRDSTDPVMMRKVQCADWLSDTVSQLETQVEQFEADLEALAPSTSKSGRNKPHRVVELEGFMQKHSEHVKKLEQVLRLLENDQVTPEEVEEALKDPLEYYLQSSTEADYVPDETIYDSLPMMKEVDDSIGKIASHTPRSGAKGKQEGEAEGGEAAAESSKPKRGKAAKERKARAAAAEAASGKGSSKASAVASAAVAPPPGLPPPPPAPPSPAAAGTPNSAGARTQSFKAVATAGIRPPAAAAAAAAAASGSPTKASPGGPETPAPGVQAGAANTPSAPPRVRVTPSPVAAPMPAQQPPVSRPPVAAAPAAQLPPPSITAVVPAPPPPRPGLPELPLEPPPQLVSQTPLEPLSPASAARVAGFSEQQASPARPPLPPPPPLEPLAQPFPPPALPVVAVPPGLARVALHAAPSGSSLSNGGSAHGHGRSPFAALASAVAAAGSPFAAAAAARQFSLETAPPPSPPAPPPRPDDQSPHSVQSSSGEAAEARRVADVAAAAQAAEIAAAAAVAAAAVSGTPRGQDTGGRIPTVLSFNHLQSQAEAVLGLAAAADGMPGAEPSTPMGGEGGVPPASHLPWIPTLADLHMLDASVLSRPQPGDGDWRLADGSMSSPGGPPPAQHPVHVPASFPNMVHPSLQRESTFRKLSAETNFFAFYFQQGTRQQLLAANALKAQGWRFHTQINAWFARQSQPRVVTSEHEQGPLVYFDALLHDVTPSSPTGLAAQPMYSGWCPRVSRSDFTFEYRYMEMEDTSVAGDP